MAKLHQLPLRLQHMPEDLYTRDIEDTTRVHRADPTHIINGTMKRYAEAQLGRVDQGEKATAVAAKALDSLHYEPGKGQPLPVTQYIVDLLRMRTLIGLARQMAKYYPDPKLRRKVKDELVLRHLWFPENRATKIQLRNGPPPGRKQRPFWLKDIALEIDLLDWPESIRRMLKERGVNCEPLLAMLKMRAKKLIGQERVIWTPS